MLDSPTNTRNRRLGGSDLALLRAVLRGLVLCRGDGAVLVPLPLAWLAVVGLFVLGGVSRFRRLLFGTLVARHPVRLVTAVARSLLLLDLRAGVAQSHCCTVVALGEGAHVVRLPFGSVEWSLCCAPLLAQLCC